ncbi:MAG TPA: alpha-1,4-glucan--maltose-1-phosphate maltosyltransferase [Longimicrobiales bacterium]|nr:alpha-1,4-glucan--maltose-1-phosphate maltosyltransferase [Longimicrobiales bacterium]
MGRRRVVIEGIEPQVEGGRFPAKAVLGERVIVEADAFTDGHDAITVVLLHRRKGARRWDEVEMTPLPNDRWQAGFEADELGRYQFMVEGWVDPFLTWQRDMVKRVAAGQDVSVDLRIGAAIVRAAVARASGRKRAEEASLLAAGADALERRDSSWTLAALDLGLAPGMAEAAPAPVAAHGGHAARSGVLVDPEQAGAEDPRVAVALSAALRELMARHPDRTNATRAEPILEVRVDRARARFSAWYEFFPRSCGPEGAHGSFGDCIARLDYVASMGFDVVYLPPIHPIGTTERKGPNNAVVAKPGDLGSPWAIGSEEGGHKAINPALGTLRDFRRFRKEAEKRGLEIALDIAFQISPDHPYVKAHPEWFRARPDGTVQYAENPPKKYEDIYPFDLETEEWRSLWEELKSIFDFWIDQGVRIFRVDNPHTKAFPFWEWCLAELERENPDVILLAEAFTRPRVMYRLAKLGFHQSYTYFAWRYSKQDFQTYMIELTTAPVRNFFRPNFWPNTPDILTEQLQTGGRPVFMQRFVLAATLSASYGIYGPAFELVETRPREPGSEEYLDSEKYQLRHWDLEASHSLRHFVARVNRIRNENPALQSNDSLRFVGVDSDMLLAYLKTADSRPPNGASRQVQGQGVEAVAGTNLILTIVNLDSYHTQGGWVWLPLEDLGIGPDETYQVHDLLGGARFQWRGHRNYVELNPYISPAHIFRIERPARSGQNADYYL